MPPAPLFVFPVVHQSRPARSRPIRLSAFWLFLLAASVFIDGMAFSTVNIQRAEQIKIHARLMTIQKLNGQGKYAEAIQRAQQLLDIYEKKGGPPSKEVAHCLDILGGLYLAFGDFDKAAPVLYRALFHKRV